MFENLKQAQRTGMTPRERGRFFFYLAMLVFTAGAVMSLKSCRKLPGRGALPGPAEMSGEDPVMRRIDRPKLLAEVSDDTPATSASRCARWSTCATCRPWA